jgi:tetratricopeptide (TPR) repeat protein
LLAWEAAYRGRFERGVEHGLAATVSLTSADREVEYQAAGFMIAGINYLYFGRHREARETLESAIALARESGVARVQSLSLAYLALLHAELSDECTALAQCSEAVALAPDPVTSAGTLSLLLHVHVRTGRAEEAKQTFARLAATVTPLGQRTPQGGVLIALAEALLLSGQLLEAARVAQEALASARGAGHRLIEGASLRLLGQCALAQEAYAEAAQRLGESRAILTELGAAFQLGRTLCALAALAQQTGDLLRSALWREEAEELYRALELPALAEHVDDVVAAVACSRAYARASTAAGVVVHATLAAAPVAASPAAAALRVATMRTS